MTTLDELVNQFRYGFSDPVVQKLASLLLEWKTNISTAQDLLDTIERYFGNSWISSEEDHRNAYHAWSSFRDDVIGRIAGMTMNERLYCFGLLDRFDVATKEEKLAIYRKLHTQP